MRQSQRGFTIIELVVVILLLGILTATALPRFISISDDAHSANVNGTGASFVAGVTLIKAKALASQATSGSDTIQSSHINGSNLPTGAAGTSDVLIDDAADCTTIWNAVMDTDISPTIGTPNLTDIPAQDYGVVLNGDVCEYAYTDEGFSIATPAASTRRISYDATASPPVSITIP